MSGEGVFVSCNMQCGGPYLKNLSCRQIFEIVHVSQTFVEYFLGICVTSHGTSSDFIPNYFYESNMITKMLERFSLNFDIYTIFTTKYVVYCASKSYYGIYFDCRISIEWVIVVYRQESNFAAISWREQDTFSIRWYVCFILHQHAKLDLYSASSLIQQFVCRYVAPLGLMYYSDSKTTSFCSYFLLLCD